MEVIPYLIMAFVFGGMYYIPTHYIFFMKKTKELSYISVSVSAIHIVMSYILITNTGMVGAAKTMLFTSVLMFVSVWIYSANVYKMPWMLKKI